MARWVLVSQATAAKRYVYFDCRDATDGFTPETGEAGGQPQIGTNGAAFTNTGIGTLTHMGNGRYWAALTVGAIGTIGDIIETRYKSANTMETPGDTIQVVAVDVDDAAGFGLSRLDAATSTRLATAGYTAPPSVGAMADAVWDEVLTGAHSIGNSAGQFLQRAGSFAEGNVQSATATTVVLDSFMSSVDNYYRDCLIGITTGTGLQQLRIIESYVGASRTCHIASDRPWIVTPDATSTWEIYTAGPAAVTTVSENSVTEITNDVTTIVSGSTPAEIWAYASRTLTMSAAAVIAAVTGSDLSWLRGDALEQTFTGLGDISDRTKLWMTIKRDLDDADADAVLQIEETDGILILLGEPPDSPIDGELTVDDEDTGAVTLTLPGLVMAQLPRNVVLYYDLQILLDGEPVTVTSSTCAIEGDVTRRTA